MNEQATAQVDAAPAPAGSLLQQAREHAGLQVETLAAMLKVPVERLLALEQGRYDALPDVTFARALALSLCRVLKVDPAAVLAQLPAGPTPDLGPPREAIDAPMPRTRVTLGLVTAAEGGRRAPLLIALGLLLLAVVLWFVLPVDSDAPVVLQGPSDSPEVATPLPTAPAPHSAAVPVEANAPAAEPPSSSAAPPSEDAADATAPTPLAAPASAAATSATDTSVVELRAQETSWVQVIGASGRIWLQRNLRPGEAVRFDQDLPLAVTVGRADATTVWVRGQPFDLTSVTRNNVARFEIR